MSIYGITKRRVQTIPSRACPMDLRGHHGNRPNKVLEEYKDKVTCYYLFDNETSSPSLL